METSPRHRFCNCTIKSHRGHAHKYTDANSMFRFTDAYTQTTMAVIIPPLLLAPDFSITARTPSTVEGSFKG